MFQNYVMKFVIVFLLFHIILSNYATNTTTTYINKE